MAILAEEGGDGRRRATEEVCTLHGANITSNVRELEGALDRLIAYSSLIGQRDHAGTAQQVLKNFIDAQYARSRSSRFRSAVAEQFGMRRRN